MDDLAAASMAQDIAKGLNVPVGQCLTPLRDAIHRIHEQGYIAGVEMERKLMRLRLGLATKEDH